jgi:hypothetical protein
MRLALWAVLVMSESLRFPILPLPLFLCVSKTLIFQFWAMFGNFGTSGN